MATYNSYRYGIPNAITLTTANQNPVTITATGTIVSPQYAIWGSPSSSYTWTIANYGTIESTGAGGFGISLGIGQITNAVGGVISGYSAIVFDGTGPSYLGNSGYIVGTGIGASDRFAVGGDVTMVRNAGTIKDDGSAGTAISLHNGGEVINGQSGSGAGLIVGASGIVAGNNTATGTVINYGTILSLLGTSANAVELTFGGFVQNGASGATTALIDAPTGNSAGVRVLGAAGTVINFGTIANTTFPVGSSNSPSALILAAGGTVTNFGLIKHTGTATGGLNGSAIYVNGSGARVTNLGTVVEAIPNTSSSGVGIYLRSDGNITNGSTAATSALVVSGHNGVEVQSRVGTIVNYGTVVSTNPVNGIAAALLAGGTVVNEVSGLITAYRTAIYAKTLPATIINTGTIESTNTASIAVSLVAGGDIVNGTTAAANALISAAGQASGVAIRGATGTVSNFATIAQFGQTSGAGVYLGAGGLITNGAPAAAGALIDGAHHGISAKNVAATVANYGTIVGGTHGAGVYLGFGGFIRNGAAGASGALIDGAHIGVSATGAPATIANYGTILGTGLAASYGVDLEAGGLITNAVGGMISSGWLGINIDGSGGTIINAGLLAGASGGVYAAGGAASVSNSGTIEATNGIAIAFVGTAGNTLTDSGTIVGGSGGTAVAFAGNNDRLILYPSYDIQGTVNGNGGTLELTGGAGTLSGLGTKFIFDALKVDNESGWTISDPPSNTAPNVIDDGSIIIPAGGTLVFKTITSDNGYTGLIDVASGATASVQGAVAATETISFAGATGTLAVGDAAQFAGAIAGFAPGDVLDLPGISLTSVMVGTNNILTLQESGGGTVSFNLSGSQSFAGDSFAVGSNGSGGSELIATPSSGAVDFLGGGNVSVGFGNANHTIVAGNGNDTITAGNGNDTVMAGNGASVVRIGNGNDKVVAGNGNDTLTAGNGNDDLTLGDGNDTITLGNGNDTVTLGNGDDAVKLGNGNDTVTLGGGTYTISAGNGVPDILLFADPKGLLTMSSGSNDQFVFSNIGFDLGVDNGLGTRTPQAIASALFSPDTDGTFATAGNRFAYDSTTGNLYYDARGSAVPGSATRVADLTNHPHLTAANLFFVA